MCFASLSSMPAYVMRVWALAVDELWISQKRRGRPMVTVFLESVVAFWVAHHVKVIVLVLVEPSAFAGASAGVGDAGLWRLLSSLGEAGGWREGLP